MSVPLPVLWRPGAGWQGGWGPLFFQWQQAVLLGCVGSVAACTRADMTSLSGYNRATNTAFFYWILIFCACYLHHNTHEWTHQDFLMYETDIFWTHYHLTYMQAFVILSKESKCLLITVSLLHVKNLNALFPYQAKRPKKEQGRKVQYCFLWNIRWRLFVCDLHQHFFSRCSIYSCNASHVMTKQEHQHTK